MVKTPKKVFDLGESASTEISKASKKWYPHLSISDSGVAGISSFDDEDIGKTIEAKVTIRLKTITKTSANKKSPFTYDFEALKLEIPQSRYSQMAKDMTK